MLSWALPRTRRPRSGRGGRGHRRPLPAAAPTARPESGPALRPPSGPVLSSRFRPVHSEDFALHAPHRLCLASGPAAPAEPGPSPAGPSPARALVSPPSLGSRFPGEAAGSACPTCSGPDSLSLAPSLPAWPSPLCSGLDHPGPSRLVFPIPSPLRPVRSPLGR